MNIILQKLNNFLPSEDEIRKFERKSVKVIWTQEMADNFIKEMTDNFIKEMRKYEHYLFNSNISREAYSKNL